MVGHLQKFQGSAYSDIVSWCGLTLGKSVSLIRRDDRAESIGITGEVSVQMGIAPVHGIRVVKVNIGRIGLLHHSWHANGE